MPAAWGRLGPLRDGQGAAAARLVELQTIIETAKAEPCLDCRLPYSRECMVFAHRPNEQARFKIGEYRYLLPSPERLREEMAKCDLLCANCWGKRRARARRAA